MNDAPEGSIDDLVFVIERMQLDPSDTVVLSTEQSLDDDTAAHLRQRLEGLLPGHKVLVLDNGLRISAIGHGAGITRIEEKLDRLIEALAEDGVELPARTLDGELFPNGERDQTQSL